MKNKREIIESKYPPRNNEDIWLKDLLLYASTTKGWLPLGSEKTYSNKTELLKDTPAGGTIGIDKETGTAYLYNDVSKEWTPIGGGGGMTETTWQELKDLRDNSQLTPGSLYRITDYNCTTTQENTRSAGHQFDIVLLALSENKLAEEGWAMMNENIYNVTFGDGVTKKCYVYTDDDVINIVDVDTKLGYDADPTEITIDDTNKTVDMHSVVYVDMIAENLPYNYFQNSNLSAWKVWYCLDNDKSRFAWADDSIDEGTPAKIIVDNGYGEFELFRNPSFDRPNNIYGWTPIPYLEDSETFTTSETPSIGDHAVDIGGNEISDITVTSYTPPIQGTGLPNGRGVVYRLIDEWNNDIKYDFKNIQFVRKLTDGAYDADNGTDTWCYTLNVWYNDMCQDASIVGNTLLNDEGYISGVYDNNFGYATAYDVFYEGVDTFAFALGDNVVLSFIDGAYYGIYSNTIGNAFCKNTIGSDFRNNMICNNFNNNIIGNWFDSNTIGNNFVNQTISDDTSFKNYGNNRVELATKDDLE